ncbi:MAG: TraC family protein, partial [Synergistaceae bacterium]
MGFSVFRHSLADDLPYEDIIDDVIIFSDGSVGCAYEITPIYVDSMEYSDIMNLERTLSAFISGLENNVQVQFLWRKTSLLKSLDSHMNQIQSGDPLLQTMAYERQKYWENKRDAKSVFGITCQIWFRKHYDRALSKPFNSIWSMGVNETAAMESLIAEQDRIANEFKNLCTRLMSPITTVTK